MSVFCMEGKMGIENKYIIKGERYSLEAKSSKGKSLFNRIVGGVISLRERIKILEDKEEYITLERQNGIKEEFKFYIDKIEVGSVKRNVESIKPEFSGVYREEKFKVKGEILGRDFVVVGEEKILGNVHKERLRVKDTYKVKVVEKDYEKLIIALGIILDLTIHN